ncbi:hypothetical protein [Caulobacter vibrioides]|uniref:hypothetical protein n=1 Tax=Caulobacter vibrioides TaxID=155892 RepID=UPI0040345F82
MCSQCERYGLNLHGDDVAPAVSGGEGPYAFVDADSRVGTVDGKKSLTVPEAALQLLRSEPGWSNQFLVPATVTYAFRATAPASMPSDTGGFSQFNAAQILQAEKALQTFSASAEPLSKSLAASMAAGASHSDAIGQVSKTALSTSGVAVLAYQFFTGKTPTAAGMDYLVNPDGVNANNLNSAYYQSFNLENRYINFAVNLGKIGEGATKFLADYGGLSLFDATRKAYATIFGLTPTDDKVRALIDGRTDYFAAYGQDGPNGQGTKAAMVGWLMAEAGKADIGVYAKSAGAFFADQATKNVYGVDLIGVYAKPEYNLI